MISFPFSYWRLYTWKGISQSIVVRSRIQRFVLLLLSVLGILLTFWFQKSFSGLCVWSWANEQHGWPFSLLNDDQMSNKIGGRSTTQFFSEQECHHCFGASDSYMNLYGQRKKTMFTASCWSHSFISCCSSKLGFRYPLAGSDKDTWLWKWGVGTYIGILQRDWVLCKVQLYCCIYYDIVMW